MTPVSKKSSSAWFTCRTCHVTLTQKDLDKHVQSSCPPSKEAWEHGYIEGNYLYGMLDLYQPDHNTGTTNSNTLKNIPKQEYSRMVLLSENAMQLCGICIGDPVLISNKSTFAIRIAWPTQERTLTSILMTREGFETFSVPYPGIAIVQKLIGIPLPAQEVHLIPNGPIQVPDVLISKVHCFYRNHVLCEGSKVSVPFYGKTQIFDVQCVIPYPVCSGNISELTESLNLFQIRDLNSGDGDLNVTLESPLNGAMDKRCFKAVESTKWLLREKQKKGECKLQEKRLLLSNIGGLKKCIQELQELMNVALKNVSHFPGLRVVRGILLYGVSGTGKTQLANCLAAESKATIFNIHGAEVYSKYFGETESRLRSLFEEAKSKAPSIILMDQIDTLCPKRSSGSSEQEKRVVAMLGTLLDSLHEQGNVPVVVLATSNKPDTLDPALRRPGRIDYEVEIMVPNPEDRVDILNKLLAKTSHHLLGEDIKDVAFAAHGFVGADLASLCSHAGMHAARRSESMSLKDFSWALTQVKPSAMREVMVQVPNVKWTDIGGQHDLKLKLCQAIEWPLKHPEAFARLGITPPKGILMFGPPGCSKTMIAKAIATESKLNFLSIKGPELFSKWVGESERAVREVFRRARQVAPSVIFFDELDALGSERSASSQGNTNVQDRVLAQLLTELDGVEVLGNVTVLAATNRPDRIDKALLRPGRLDRIVYVPLPDEATRTEIFSLKFSKMPVAVDVDIQELVQRTEGYSGAEVVAVCHEAALKALEQDLGINQVSHSHFMTALELVTPRTPAPLLQLYEEYCKR